MPQTLIGTSVKVRYRESFVMRLWNGGNSKQLTTKRKRVSDATVGICDSDQVVIRKVTAWSESSVQVRVFAARSVVLGCLVGQALLVVKVAVAFSVAIAIAVGRSCGSGSVVGVSGGSTGSGHLSALSDLRHVGFLEVQRKPVGMIVMVVRGKRSDARGGRDKDRGRTSD